MANYVSQTLELPIYTNQVRNTHAYAMYPWIRDMGMNSGKAICGSIVDYCTIHRLYGIMDKG